MRGGRQRIECSTIDVPEADKAVGTFTEEVAPQVADRRRSDGGSHPICVRPNPAAPDRYLLVQGRHRLYATRDVLREQLIEANVLADMDDAEAEMARVTEGLWRESLTQAQLKKALKRWWEHYIAKHPEKGIRGAAGGTARKKAAEKNGSAARAGEGAGAAAKLAAGVTAGAATRAQTARRSSEFAEMVAAATGMAKRTAERALRLAKVFRDDQLDLFEQRAVTQADQEAIAKIKDEAQRNEVVDGIGRGRGSKDAIKEVMKDQARGQADSRSEEDRGARKQRKDIEAPELPDDEWFTVQ